MFGMIRIGSNTDIGMNRNSSNWPGMNSYPILFPGIPYYYCNKFQYSKHNTTSLKLLSVIFFNRRFLRVK